VYGERERVHLFHVTYKPGTKILDESEPLALAVGLAQAGRRIVIHESVVAELGAHFSNLFEYGDAFSLERIP